MFSIFKKPSIAATDFFPFQTDMHSHILPGIDDGSPDIETSVKLVEGLMKLGIKQSIATPHIIGDIYRNDETTINAALNKLRNALEEQQIDFKLSAAAEYMLDSYFFDLLKAKKPLLTLKDNIILTEFSYSERPYGLEQMVFSIITEGYNPILAHPERYAYYHNDFNEYFNLRDLGFNLQINMLSLTGYYGKPAAKAAAFILKNNLASFAGTDLHHDRHMEALHLPAHRSVFAEAFGEKMMNEELRVDG